MTNEVRSRQDLATIFGQPRRPAVNADTIICTTEHGELARHLRDADPSRRLIAASPRADTLEVLHDDDDGIEPVTMATRVADRYRQARLVIGSALAVGPLEEGDLVVCVVGHRTSLGGGDLITVIDLDETSQIRGVGDLVGFPTEVGQAAVARV